MASTTYSYDKDPVYPVRLSQEILASAITNVATEFDGIEDDHSPTPTVNLYITFLNALSSGDEAILDAVVAAHPTEPTPEPGDTVELDEDGYVPAETVPPFARFNRGYTMFSAAGDPFRSAKGGGNLIPPTWTVLGRFIFAGTDSVGSPTTAKAVVSRSGATAPVSVRIYDLTNNLAIVTATDITPTTDSDDPDVVSLGTISNLPTGESVFEIQANSSSASVDCEVHFVNIFTES